MDTKSGKTLPLNRNSRNGVTPSVAATVPYDSIRVEVTDTTS